jgi:Trypsin-like peptidase domain/Carboxypeptidase regulatory-like domain
VLAAAVLALTPAFVAHAQISSDVLESAILKTVYLVILDAKQEEFGGCSGSFVASSGLMLMAAHCVRAEGDDPKHNLKKGQLYNPDGLLAVGVNLVNHVKPVSAYMARRVVDDPRLDLALLQVSGLLGDEFRAKPLAGELHLPEMALGNAAAVRVGEPIAVLGFPDVGGDTVTVAEGHVTGFMADDRDSKFQMKHDCAVGSGASGGPVITARGEQVAVHLAGRADPSHAARSSRAVLADRIPSAWAQHFRGGPPSVKTQPTAPAPPPPGRTPVQTRPFGTSPAAPAVPARPPSASVVLQGRIVDADSGAGIAGASVLVLRPGATTTQSNVVADAQTDGNGAFRTAPPVPRGATYPVVIQARGYRTVSGTVGITAEDPEVVVLRPV